MDAVRCAFLGLGVMGGPMARHLGAAGHALAVWNRTAAKAEAWRAAGGLGETFAEAAEAINGRDLVFMCLGDDPDVEAVFAAIAPAIASGMVLVDHTTGSPALARRLAEACRARGAEWIDAPVSGGQAGAEKGQLAVMAGGDADALARALPVMKAYSRQITHIGPSGAGQLAKGANQIAIAGAVQGVAEALHFAREAGLDTDRVLEAISGGAAQSWQMVNRWPTMTEGRYDFGFAVDWMRKDLRIVLDEARRTGASLPVAALVDQFYAEVQSMGGGRWDTSSLLARLERNRKP